MLPIFGVMMALVLVLKESRTEPLTVKPALAAAAPSEARQLVAKAWEQMIKPEMARVELDAADNLCKRAAELDPNDAEVWAAWSQVDSWYVYHRLESTPARREGARKKAALALSLSAQSYEARLAQACYLMREGGGQSATQYTADAEAGLRALLQERPDEPRALLSLGILQRNLGQVAAFRDSFGRMARSPAFAVQAFNELGWAEYFLGNFREAEAAIDASIKLHPYWANLNLKTYLLLCWWGDLDRAKLTADRIPVSGSQENYGLSVHLQVNQWRRDPPAMLRVINSVSRDWLQSNAADGPKAWWTGLAQQMTGQTEVARLQWGIALKVVEQRLGDQPDSGHLLDWKGRLLLALGRRAEGESSLRLAHAMGFKGYFDDDALSLILMGKEDAAIALLESRGEEKEVF